MDFPVHLFSSGRSEEYRKGKRKTLYAEVGLFLRTKGPTSSILDLSPTVLFERQSISGFGPGVQDIFGEPMSHFTAERPFSQ